MSTIQGLQQDIYTHCICQIKINCLYTRMITLCTAQNNTVVERTKEIYWLMEWSSTFVYGVDVLLMFLSINIVTTSICIKTTHFIAGYSS